jgi:hypothetical protein
MCANCTGQRALKSKISTNTTELQSHISAEAKSDMSEIRADLITQEQGMQNKMSNCVSVIRQELRKQICDLCDGEGKLKGLDKRRKNVNALVE